MRIFGMLFSVRTALASEVQDSLWRDFLDLIPSDGAESVDELLSGIGIDRVLGEVIRALESALTPAFGFFALLMGLAAILSVCDAAPTLGTENSAVSVASVIATSAVLLEMRGAVSAVSEGLSSLSNLFSGLIPIFTGILAAGGQAEGASLQAFNMNITLGAITYISSELMTPLVSSAFCLSALSGLDGGGVSKIAKGIKSTFTFILGLAVSILAAVLSLQSLLTSARDGAYLRAARYAASGMIPVVGGTVSSALATLSGGLSLLRTGVGAGSVAAIVGISLTPLITLLLYRLALSISISVLESVGASSSGARSFGAVRGALDLVTALYSVSVIAMLLEVITFLKCGVDMFG